MQTSVRVDFRIGAEGFHHGLMTGLRMERPFKNNITASEHRVRISGGFHSLRAQIPPVVRTDIAECFPGFLRMYQRFIIHSGTEIQHCRLYIVFYFNQTKSLVHRRFILSGNDGDRITDKAHAAVKDQPVIRRGFGIGLSRHGEAFLRNILVGVYCRDSRNLCRNIRTDRADQCVSIRTAKNLYDKAVRRCYIVHIRRFSEKKLHRILFAYTLAYRFHITVHSRPSFRAFRNARMPRVCPSYPEQRQRFPARYARISSSVGSGFSRSRAMVFITKPGLQKPHCSAP